MALVFDIETNGLLDTLTKVHVLVIRDTCTGITERFDQGRQADGVKKLMQADSIVGHNIIDFDIPALKKVYPWFDFPKEHVLDTLIWARLAFADIKEGDFARHAEGRLPGDLIGSHKLEAYGYRLGVYKGNFCKTTDWAEWSPEMSDYCEQDVVVTEALLNRLLCKEVDRRAIVLEHKTAWIISRQMKNGFGFDEQGAQELYAKLVQRKAELDTLLRQSFGPIPKKDFIPKRNDRVKGYVKGVPVKRFAEFNPGSRDHIIYHLLQMGWVPDKDAYTPGGKPKLDEEILSKLTFPEAKPIIDYLLVDKRLGQLGDGDKAWLKEVKNGKIHGYVDSCGAVTGRMTHSNPNVAQVPAVRAPYGHECRALFRPTRPGWVQVGCDASGLELRCLGHYIAYYDDGAYIKLLLEGDVHTAHQHAAGLQTRDQAKKFIYAFLYGAGDAKIGEIVGGTDKDGKRLKKAFLSKTPAIASLREAVAKRAKEKGVLKGLDGRELRVRSQHSALNLLLQSAGALVMKQALVILDEDIQALGYEPGRDYEFMANIHDEWQIECKPEIAEEIGKTAVAAIRKAGEVMGFRCPLDGEYKIGRNWADCH